MISIIDCTPGNHKSVINMLKKIGVSNVNLTSDKDLLSQSKLIILPGVGNFENVINILRENQLDLFLKKIFEEKKIFFLGICAGMQILFEESEESNESGLCIFKGELKKFLTIDKNNNLPIPQMGWNFIEKKKDSAFIRDLDLTSKFYFVHSYYVKNYDANDILATTKYIVDFPSIINKNKFFGVQFHPEKSHKFGTKIFENLVKMIDE